MVRSLVAELTGPVPIALLRKMPIKAGEGARHKPQGRARRALNLNKLRDREPASARRGACATSPSARRRRVFKTLAPDVITPFIAVTVNRPRPAPGQRKGVDSQYIEPEISVLRVDTYSITHETLPL
ncbi:hypothetical protein EVAR_92383_1 [Eumeta japonica]|uniref:Uncharacterized protein n=1 Tax=Eumeta variegata TaxID=151549 RepID=A0A4C1TIS5_EUMVA|nr:hypothetical protein EVAR_92383_1 [Eumeta japonica]